METVPTERAVVVDSDRHMHGRFETDKKENEARKR